MVFDIDGTLIDTEEAVITSLQKVLSEALGQVYSKDELSFALGIPGVTTLKKFEINNIDHFLEKWIKYMDDLKDSIKVFDGIDNCLRRLKADNIKTGIVTSKTKEEFNINFVPYGLMKYFDYVVCADDTYNHKPHPEPILKFLEISGNDPESVVYIGDTKYDKECAQGAGVKFALALWGARSTEGMGSSYILHNPNDILDITTNKQRLEFVYD